MPNTNSHQLYDLVQSLDRSEKRFFKLYARSRPSAKGNADAYLALFDQLNGMREFDAAAVRHALHCTPKQFSNLSYYLYELLMKALVAYAADKSVSGQLRNYLARIDLLDRKGLQKQAMRLIRRAKKLALKHEKHTVLVQLCEREILIGVYTRFAETPLEDLQQIQAEQLHWVETEARKIRCEGVAREFFYYKFLYDRARTPEQEQHFAALLATPDLHVSETYNSTVARTNYHWVLGNYAMMQSDPEGYLHHMELARDAGAALPRFEEEYPMHWLGILYNLMIAQQQLGHYHAALATLQNFRQVEQYAPKMQYLSHLHSYIFELDLRNAMGEFEAGRAVVEQIEAHFSAAVLRNPAVDLLAWRAMFYLYFGLRDYVQASRCLRQLLSIRQDDRSVRVVSELKVLQLILHLEMGEWEGLEAILQSTRRFLLRRKRLHKVESALLTFIGAVIEAPHAQQSAYASLLTTLQAALQDPYERTFLQYFDLHSWVECKLSGRSFSEILRSKAVPSPSQTRAST